MSTRAPSGPLPPAGPTTPARGTPVTAAELAAMPNGGEGYELIRGQLHRVSPVKPTHAYILHRIDRALGEYTDRTWLGQVWPGDVGFRVMLSRGTESVLAPDIAFVVASRASLSDEESWFDGAPDLAIEIVSPSQSDSSSAEKARDWLAGGAREIWVANPPSRTIAVYRDQAKSPVVYAEDGELVSPGLLPGFRLRVSAVFPPKPA